MKNKLTGKDYQPIRFHRGRPDRHSPVKQGKENDLSEDDADKKEGATQQDSKRAKSHNPKKKEQAK